LKLFYYIPERIYRVLGVVFFLSGVAHKIYLYPNYTNKILWGFEATIFFSIAVFFAIRKPVVEEASGFGETVVPLAGGVWPFLLLFTPRGSFGLANQDVILLVMCLGTGFSLLSYLFLNTSFTIMVEARELKDSGPYRYVRHPVYTGQIITALAVLSWRFSWLNLLICLVFIYIQNYRASLEEKKLSSVFPEYEKYAEDKARFFPCIW
jgi:protein-S-isoprenylcysteine O-methyltransferase Ste14